MQLQYTAEPRPQKLLKTTGTSESLGPTREQSLILSLHESAARTRGVWLTQTSGAEQQAVSPSAREHQQAKAAGSASLPLLGCFRIVWCDVHAVLSKHLILPKKIFLM